MNRLSWFLLPARNGDRSPEVLKTVFNQGAECRRFMERPDEHGSQYGLKELHGRLLSLHSWIDFAALLTCGNQFPNRLTCLEKCSFHDFSHALATEEGRNQRTGKRRTSPRLFR